MAENQETSGILFPKGFHLDDHEGRPILTKDRGMETHTLVNRYIGDLDSYFNGAFTNLLDETLAAHQDRPVRVLDVGGGMHSLAVKELSQQYVDRVHAVNLDIAHHITEGAGAPRVLAFATKMPLADESVDFAFSRQLFPFINGYGSKHKEGFGRGISEVARVLAPGGCAVLDDAEELSGPQAAKRRERLAKELGVVFEVQQSANMKSATNFPKFWSRYNRPEQFLIMRKPQPASPPASQPSQRRV